MPADQRIDDGASLCFDSEPFGEGIEFLGAPRAEFEVSVDQPNAFVVLRLCDVAPNGESLLITYGVLNLTHRNGHERLEPLTAGKRYAITVDLNSIAFSLAPGHKLRLAMSTSYWPIIWPSPEPVTLTVYTGGTSRLRLPVRPKRDADTALASFGPPEQAETVPHTVIRIPKRGRQTIATEVPTGETRLVSSRDRAAYYLPSVDLEHSGFGEDVHTIRKDDPLSARSETYRSVSYGRGAWQVRVDTRTVLTATRDDFLVTAELDAFEGTERVATRRWNERIPRTGV
jgi:hypothetical protein